MKKFACAIVIALLSVSAHAQNQGRVGGNNIPPQGGHSGQFLKAGPPMSWSAVSALPSQTGQGGKYLTTDGIAASWGTVSTLTCPSCTANAALYYTGSLLASTPWLWDNSNSRYNTSGLWGRISLSASVNGESDFGFFDAGANGNSYIEATKFGIRLIANGSPWLVVGSWGTQVQLTRQLQLASTGLKFSDATSLTTVPVTSVTAGTGLSGGVITTTGTVSMPNTGPGAATYCGSGQFVTSEQLDAQGRTVAVTCATPTVAPIELYWSPVNYLLAGLGTPTCTGGNFTAAMAFNMLAPATISGVRFYYPDTTSRNIKVSIWDDTGTRVATSTAAYNTVGAKTVTFGSTVSVSTAHTFHQWFASLWETSGSCYLKFTTPNSSVSSPVDAMPAFPFINGPHIMYLQSAYQSGDAVPVIGNAGGTEDYPIEPIFTVP